MYEASVPFVTSQSAVFQNGVVAHKGRVNYPHVNAIASIVAGSLNFRGATR